ncbi:MAG TPA: hypothetical protein VFS54_12385 [Solirubrobacterales bacterium]|nr:hypothetical protein [Solirubrobacterales bacterium]
MRRPGNILLPLFLGFACFCLGPLAGQAAAAPSVESSSLSLSSTQAGVHSDLSVSVALEDPGEPESAKDLLIDLPPGYFFFPSWQVRCTTAEFSEDKCPVDSQVGVVTVRGNYGGDPDFELGEAAIRLLTPQSGQLARLGFLVPTLESPVEISITAPAENENGLALAIEGLPSAAPLQSLDLDVWGVPASQVHDELRFPIIPGGRQSNQPLIPFTRNPTSCQAVSGLTVEVDSHQEPGVFASATGTAPFIGGCGKLAFHPVLETGLTSTEAMTPAGLNLAVTIPADMTPSGLSVSDAEEVFVALPPQLVLDEGSLASGPSLGSFTATVLGTEPTLEGDVYFDGTESAGTYRLLLVGAGSGIDLEAPAYLEYDGGTASWALALSLPQLPFEELELHLASPSGPFAASACGAFEVPSEMFPWSGSPARLAVHTLSIDSGPNGGPCPVPTQDPGPPSSAPTTVAPQPSPRPVVKLRRRPPTQTTDRTPTFRFSPSVPGGAFECRIDRHPLRRCKSPLTLPQLSYGHHVFKVRAVYPDGRKSRYAVHGFTVHR